MVNRYKNNKNAVSPVIATILMVAITVVLAGVLVVYLQTLPSNAGTVTTNLGLNAQKTPTSDWLVSVSGGSQAAANVRLQIIDPASGGVVTTTLPSPGTYSFIIGTPANWGAVTVCGKFNDNNGNTKLDAGDSLLLYSATGALPANGKDLSGMKLQLMVGSNIVGTIGTLPS